MKTYDGHIVKVSSKSTDCKITVSVVIFARTDFTIVREHQYLKWISYNSYFKKGREIQAGNPITLQVRLKPTV